MMEDNVILNLTLIVGMLFVLFVVNLVSLAAFHSLDDRNSVAEVLNKLDKLTEITNQENILENCIFSEDRFVSTDTHSELVFICGPIEFVE